MNRDTKSKSPDKSRPSLSKGQLWLFRIIAAFVAPVLTLVLLEVILRVAGFGYPAGAFVRGEVKGRPVYCSNIRFGWRFFPPELAREFSPFVVPADPRQLLAGAGKADNTYRIFILGESAAQGEPDATYCFGRMLRVMLRQQYPSVNFEVFTAAMPAINSHAIVLIAKDCARLKPDLFVVYMGNNEVVGPYGAGTAFAPLSKSLVLIRMGVAIRATRLGQLMTRLAAVSGYSGRMPKIWDGLEMFLDKQIRRDDKRMRYVYSHFRRNLEDIIRIAQKAGAKAIISTVAVNLKDCPPLASLHRPDIGEQKKQFDNFYQNGVQLERAGDFKGAIEDYLAAARIDDTYAELQFRLGRCQWNLGQFDKARQSYTRAMDLDTLRFRADSNINRIIREVGAGKTDQGVYLVDAADVFEQRSPQACPGFEFFFEHVHLNFSGNYLLAGTVSDLVEGILPDRIKTQKSKDAGLPSEDECAKLLAFTNYDNLRITQQNLRVISERQPFVNQAYHDEIVDIWRQKAERLRDGIGPDALDEALEQYEQAIKFDTTDRRRLRMNFARLLLEGKKNTYAAGVQYHLIAEEVPNDHVALATLASMEVALGDIDSALKHATRAIEIMPADTVANYAAGVGYQKKGQWKKAQRYFAATIRFDPKYVQAYTNLSKILIQQGKYEQAERVYRKGIEAIPDDPALHLEMASLLRRQGLWQEADIEQQKAIALDPNIAARLR